VGELSNQLVYIATINNLPVGETPVSLRFIDKIGNEFTQELTLSRKAFTFPFGFTEIRPWPDANYVLNGDDLIAKVDKSHRLLEDYIPQDLVDLNKQFGLYTLNNAQLRIDAAVALKHMLDQLAKETGEYVTVASGYRSYETQLQTYSGWVSQYGEAEANKFSAKPGHSEHQLGTTFDLVNEDTDWKITNDFGTTNAGKWLAANCERYGFIFPYKQDESNNNGYVEESWHFRYIGLENVGAVQQ
jgi:D-alanyl-D-alanine carboxypeptidase